MYAFIIPQKDFGYGPECDESLARRLAETLVAMGQEYGIACQVAYYYDECEDPIEHGVRFEAPELPQGEFITLLHQIKDGCMLVCDAVEFQLPS